MKFFQLPESVQEQAAVFLTKKLDDDLEWGNENRTDEAKKIAKTVREAFEELFD